MKKQKRTREEVDELLARIHAQHKMQGISAYAASRAAGEKGTYYSALTARMKPERLKKILARAHELQAQAVPTVAATQEASGYWTASDGEIVFYSSKDALNTALAQANPDTQFLVIEGKEVPVVTCQVRRVA